MIDFETLWLRLARRHLSTDSMNQWTMSTCYVFTWPLTIINDQTYNAANVLCCCLFELFVYLYGVVSHWLLCILFCDIDFIYLILRLAMMKVASCGKRYTYSLSSSICKFNWMCIVQRQTLCRLEDANWDPILEEVPHHRNGIGSVG